MRVGGSRRWGSWWVRYFGLGDIVNEVFKKFLGIFLLNNNINKDLSNDGFENDIFIRVVVLLWCYGVKLDMYGVVV